MSHTARGFWSDSFLLTHFSLSDSTFLLSIQIEPTRLFHEFICKIGDRRTADNIDINIAINQLLDDAVDTSVRARHERTPRNAIHLNRK